MKKHNVTITFNIHEDPETFLSILSGLVSFNAGIKIVDKRDGIIEFEQELINLAIEHWNVKPKLFPEIR